MILPGLQPSAGANGTLARCAPRSAELLLSNGRAQVFRLSGRTYGCVRGHTRRRALGDVPLSDGPTGFRVGNLRLVRTLVAYSFDVSRDEVFTSVRVKELRTGRLVHNTSAITGLPDRPDFTLKPGVTDLELQATGDVAWIARNVYVRPVQLEVFSLRGSRKRLLDAGTEIAPTSLRLTSTGARWLSSGVERSEQQVP